MSRYPHLFSPLEIGNVTVRNRIMQTAHVKLFTHNGVDSARNVAYQVERAKGGAGLLITGNRLVHPTSTTGMPRFSFAYLKGALEADREMTTRVHEHGAKIFAQLNHFGLNATSDSADDLRVLWGPSGVKSPAYGEIPKAMEHEDIDEVVEWWARSAELTREGGFDGTEVHIAHSYLLHTFLSPVYNKRTDEYGGSFENRLRFSREVIAAIRQRVGRDWVVGVRLTLSDFIPGGLTIGDAIRTARMLEEDGLIDCINVSAAGYHNVHLIIPPSDTPDGHLVELTAELKSAVSSLPVFTVGGIKDAAFAEAIVATGKADMVAMTRAQIADPDFANKARDGRDDEITHCIRGNQGCIGRVFKGLSINCTVNPAAGREARFGSGTLIPAASPKDWLVVGGGPAGMKAAATLAARGHHVTLLEKSDRLGGQVNLILKTPGRETFEWVTKDLERDMRQAGVDVQLGVEATADHVRGTEPDGVVVATGAVASNTGFSIVNPLVERLPGVEHENVLTVWDVLEGTKEAGERVVVLDDDGSRYASGVCEVLLDAGKQVEIVSRFNALVPYTLYNLELAHVYARVMEKGITDRLNCWASGFDGRSLTVFNLYTGAESVVEGVDTLVLATGPKADEALYFELKGQIRELHRIGDCVAPRKLDHAIYEGYLAGRELWDSEERYIYEGELERWEEAPVAS
ncbi:MAG: FAD-dependent oxidoreductase [Actinomycetia bacterium]|nr:FAD-dependent oxidoreductase [Actinomycetes bacterium]